MFKILLEWSILAYETTYFEKIRFTTTSQLPCLGIGLRAIIL